MLKKALPGRSAVVPLIEYSRQMMHGADGEHFRTRLAVHVTYHFLLNPGLLNRFEAQTTYRFHRGRSFGQHGWGQGYLHLLPAVHACSASLLVRVCSRQVGKWQRLALQVAVGVTIIGKCN